MVPQYAITQRHFNLDILRYMTIRKLQGPSMNHHPPRPSAKFSHFPKIFSHRHMRHITTAVFDTSPRPLPLTRPKCHNKLSAIGLRSSKVMKRWCHRRTKRKCTRCSPHPTNPGALLLRVQIAPSEIRSEWLNDEQMSSFLPHAR